MKALLLLISKHLAGMVVLQVAINVIVAVLRPVFYPDGLPGGIVLIALLGMIGFYAWWLYVYVWPLINEIEMYLLMKVLKKHYGD